MEDDVTSLELTVSRETGRAEADAALRTPQARPRNEHWPVAHYGADNTDGGLRARNGVVARLVKTKLTATFDRKSLPLGLNAHFVGRGTKIDPW